MLGELRSQRQQIEEAIMTLERLARGRGRRRGRPPKWMANTSGNQSSTAAPRQKRVISAEARARMAAAQRKRWAERRAKSN
jgi:hypothetical protein